MNSNSHGARPVHLITIMISGLLMNNSLSIIGQHLECSLDLGLGLGVKRGRGLVYGLRFRVDDLWFIVSGLWFGVQGL